MFRQTIAEGLHILKTHPLRGPFEKRYLLPLAILGSVLISENDVAVIRDKFDMITRRSNSSIAWHLCEILEDIWKSQVSSAQNFVMDGLGKLLRGADIGSSPGHS